MLMPARDDREGEGDLDGQTREDEGSRDGFAGGDVGAQGGDGEGEMMEAEGLVKDKLAWVAAASADEGEGAKVIMNKDIMAAFAESVCLFIHYYLLVFVLHITDLTFCQPWANDVCKDEKMQSINAEDVFKALDDIEFPEFIDPLRTALEDMIW